MKYFILNALIIIFESSLRPCVVNAANNNHDETYTDGLYSQSHRKYWLETKSHIEIRFHGCRWSDIYSSGNEGCREDESEDGTSYWYQMANCPRANVVYSLYGSDSSKKCNGGTFLDSFVTKNGLLEFASIMSTYDSKNSPITYNDVAALPQCQEDGSGYYENVGCSSKGEFTIDRFKDQYCLQYVATVNTLDTINNKLKKMSCYDCTVNNYNYNNNNNNNNNNNRHRKLEGENNNNNNNNQQWQNEHTLCDYLLSGSSSCSPIDSAICENPYGETIKRFSKFARRALTDENKVRIMNTFGTIFLAIGISFFVGVMLANRRMNKEIRNIKKKRRVFKMKEGEYA